jgi:phosphoglycerate dehydrogenase-like enzyme
MGRIAVLWCWVDVPWIPKYLPPDKVDLKILSMKNASPSEEDLLRFAKDADVIVVRRYFQITKEVIQAAKHLKLIQRMGRMVGNIDVAAAQEAGVPVAILPMGLDMAVAEHAIMFMLALSRMLIESHQSVASGEYETLGLTPTVTTERSGIAECWVPLPIDAVYQKTLGIIGMGDIGIAVAERARGFGMRLLYFKRNRLPEEEERRLGIQYTSLEQLLSTSDFVSLHVPHTRETDKMLGKKEFALMKPTAHLINVSRGGVIDERALCEALKSKVIAGAGLDVFEKEPLPKESPLPKLENVICTPHSAAIYPTGSNIIYDVQRASENIFSVARGGPLVHGSVITRG